MLNVIKNFSNPSDRKTKKINFTGFILFLICQLVFNASFFLLFDKSVQAATAYDYAAGTYTDNFSNNSGVPSAGRSYVNVNTLTGKLQLTSAASQTTFTTPYAASGYAFSSEIQPTLIAKWGAITFTTTTPANTTLKVQITDDGNDLFSDSYIPGNSAGLQTNSIDISNIPIFDCALPAEDSNCDKPYTIKIKFLMTTTDPTNAAATPTVDNLTVTWTTTQGDLTAAGPDTTSPWPAYGVDQKGTFHSPYANSATYPVFKWASEKYINDFGINTLYILNDRIFGNSTFYGGYLFAQNRDTGAEFWRIPFAGNHCYSGTISSNGTFYGTDMCNDGFYAINTNTGQLKWLYNFSGGHGNSQTVLTSDGVSYTIRKPTTGSTFTLYAFNPNGSIKWQKNYTDSENAGDTSSQSAISVGADETLYINSITQDANGVRTNQGKLYAIDPDDPVDPGVARWTYPAGDLDVFAPIIDSDGTIYAVTPHDSDPETGDPVSSEKKIFAINSDGTKKWETSLGTDAGWGFLSLSLRSDGVLLALRQDTGNYSRPSKLEAIRTSDGFLLWSEDTTTTNFDLSFTNGSNGVFYVDNTQGGEADNYARINYYDSNNNFKWKINYSYNNLDGENELDYSFSNPTQDERGWLYSSLGKTYYSAGNDVPAQEYARSFALSPWTLTNTSATQINKNGGDTLIFSVNTSMQQTNPLLGGDNQVQVVIDNGDLVPLTYSSSDGSGNTVWTGSYVLPSTTACGTHQYAIEAGQAYLQTDVTTHFASAPAESNNTGLTAAGSFNSRACGGGGSSGDSNPPAPPSGGGGGSTSNYAINNKPDFQVIINNNDKTTTNREVALNLIGGPDAARMSLSNTPDFFNAIQEDYQATKLWDLCSSSGNVIKDLTCPAGEKTVYAKFFTKYGMASNIVWDKISYIQNTANSQTPATSHNPVNQTGQGNSVGVNTFNSFNILNFPPFSKDLKFGQQNADVKKLQLFLNSDPATQIAKIGPGSPGKETVVFGNLTKLAVIKFQEKYAEDILTPLGLKKGTGIFSKNTRAKVNALMGR
jgi:hypothetical protein